MGIWLRARTIPQKAIRAETVTMTGFSGKQVKVRLPYVVDELCNGCGICEYVCPLEGKAGIEVFALKDKTPLRETTVEEPAADANPYR